MPVTFQSSSLLRSFQASFNKQPKVLAIGHSCSQHPPPPPAVYFLPLKSPAAPTSCRRRHLCCRAAEPICGNSAAAGTGLAGGSAAGLLPHGEPGPPGSGIDPVFSNREKLNYCRLLLLLASQELHLVCTSSDVGFLQGEEKSGFFVHSKAGWWGFVGESISII